MELLMIGLGASFNSSSDRTLLLLIVWP